MKQLGILTLALAMTLTLAACGGGDAQNAAGGGASTGSQNVQDSSQDSQTQDSPSENNKQIPTPEANSKLVFTYQGCPLPMNAGFAPLLDYIGEPDNYFEAASCAFEGLDKTYTYSDLEIITYPDEEVDYISSVRLLSSSAVTPEGITIGSSKEDVVAAYGEEYESFGDMYSYVDGDTTLEILFQDDTVTSVEYIAENPLLA